MILCFCQNAINILKEKLIPLSTIVTPNLPEAYRLIDDSKEIETIAHQILKLGCKSVLIKGGHTAKMHSNDLFMDALENTYWIESERIKSKNTHGTGCTLSSAIMRFYLRMVFQKKWRVFMLNDIFLVLLKHQKILQLDLVKDQYIIFITYLHILIKL